MDEHTHWLIWDGDCGLCRRSVGWVRERDTRQVFRTSPFQETPSPPMTPELRERAKHAVQVVKPDGSVIEAGRAAACILEMIGWRWTARLMMFPLFRPLTEWGYRRVANNRQFFGRFLFRKSRVDKADPSLRSE
jgi:predicted DCC family thiol-disulfide oxidoreductase YuxK